jgi:hypothetical protein
MDNIQFTKLATPYTISLTIPVETLQPILDKHWNSVKDNLPPNIVKKAMKGGFREINQDRVISLLGGPQKFYAYPIINYINQSKIALEDQAILIWETFNFSVDDVNYTVFGTIYLEPKVYWTCPTCAIPAHFTSTLPESDVSNIDKAVDAFKQSNPTSSDDDYNAFRRQLENQQVKSDEDIAFKDIIGQLQTLVTIDPIPRIWTESYLSQFKLDNNAQYNQIAAIANATLELQLVLRSWGIYNNIAGDSSFINIKQYSDSVKKHLLNIVGIIREDTTNESTST